MAGRAKRDLRRGEAAGLKRAGDGGALIRVPKRLGRQRSGRTDPLDGLQWGTRKCVAVFRVLT